MKDEALSIIKAVADPAQKLNILREYVQSQALRSLHERQEDLEDAALSDSRTDSDKT